MKTVSLARRPIHPSRMRVHSFMRTITLMRAITLAFALHFAFSLAAVPAFAESEDLPARISGSVKNRSGYVGLREDIPDDQAHDWYSATEASARAERNGEEGRFYAAAWTQFDAAEDDWRLSLDEAWAEWTPADFFAGKLGRFGVQFGPCLAFNLANSLVTKDAFDDRANKVGLDGISLDFRPLLVAEKAESALALTLTACLFLPGDASGETAPNAGDRARQDNPLRPGCRDPRAHRVRDRGNSPPHGRIGTGEGRPGRG